MLDERQLRERGLAGRAEGVNVLVVGRKELCEGPLAAGVDRVARGGDVSGGVARVLLVFVRRRGVDVPVFADVVGLFLLVVVALLDVRVELGRVLVGIGLRIVGPVLDLGLVLVFALGLRFGGGGEAG